MEVTLDRALLMGEEGVDDEAASLRSLIEVLRERGGSGEWELGGR